MTLKWQQAQQKTSHEDKIQYMNRTSSLYKEIRSDHSIQSMNAYTVYHKTKPQN